MRAAHPPQDYRPSSVTFQLLGLAKRDFDGGGAFIEFRVLRVLEVQNFLVRHWLHVAVVAWVWASA